MSSDNIPGKRSVDWDDPTQNVRELFKAESLRQDGARDAMKELVLRDINALRENVIAQIGAETRRIDQIAMLSKEFQATIREMLAESVRTTSALVANQLVQFNATFDSRVSKLEAGAFTQAGKQSISDPATADAIAAIRMLTNAQKESVGQGIGQGQVIAWAIAAASAAAAITTVIVHLKV